MVWGEGSRHICIYVHSIRVVIFSQEGKERRWLVFASSHTFVYTICVAIETGCGCYIHAVHTYTITTNNS